MNVHAVADAVGIGLWRKGHPMAEPVCDGARHLAGDDRVVGGDQRRLRHHRHLELARAVFGEKRVRNHPGSAHGGGERLTKAVLAAEGAEGVSVARAVG